MSIFKLSILTLLVSFIIISCTKVENNYITVEDITVQFESKELVTKVQSTFNTKASTRSSVAPFTHKIPSNYKAYFVASEDRGQYSKDQLIKTIDVTEGVQEITIPKLKYKVIVSSYDLTESQVRNESNNLSTLITKLPYADDIIYLIGLNDINYVDNNSGKVEVINPYAAVMITNNEWVKSVPKYNHNSVTDQSFKLVHNNQWYLKYIRANGSSTINVPVKGNLNTYTISDKFKENTVYQYTFNGVGNTTGNFEVDVLEIFMTVEDKNIDLY